MNEHGGTLRSPARLRRRFAMSFMVVTASFAVGCAGDPPADDPEPFDPQDVPTQVDEARPELVRVTGTLEAGNTPGCLVLNTGSKAYELVGYDQVTNGRDLEVGEERTVTGMADSSATGTCSQGVPLTVSGIDPAS